MAAAVFPLFHEANIAHEISKLQFKGDWEKQTHSARPLAAAPIVAAAIHLPAWARHHLTDHVLHHLQGVCRQEAPPAIVASSCMPSAPQRTPPALQRRRARPHSAYDRNRNKRKKAQRSLSLSAPTWYARRMAMWSLQVPPENRRFTLSASAFFSSGRTKGSLLKGVTQHIRQ